MELLKQVRCESSFIKPYQTDLCEPNCNIAVTEESKKQKLKIAKGKVGINLLMSYKLYFQTSQINF